MHRILWATKPRANAIAHRCIDSLQLQLSVINRSLSTSKPSISIQHIADQLRDYDNVIKGDREHVTRLIQSVTINGKSMDEREVQAQQLVSSDVLKPILHFLRDERVVDFHIPSFLSLLQISSEPLITNELLRLEAIDVIASYLSQSDGRLQLAACLLLGHLALDPSANTSNLPTPKVIDPLLDIVHNSKHIAIQRAVLTTLASVAGMQPGRVVLSDADRMETISEKLTDLHGMYVIHLYGRDTKVLLIL